MNKNQICEGCLLKHYDNYYRCIIDENYAFKRIEEVCPCQTCLIKSMCRTYCLPFLNFLYIALTKHYTKSNQLREKFNDISQRRRTVSREEALVFLQYCRNSLDMDENGYSRFSITSRLIKLNYSDESDIVKVSTD